MPMLYGQHWLDLLGYKNKQVKPHRKQNTGGVELVLKRVWEGQEGQEGGMYMIMFHCMHV